MYSGMMSYPNFGGVLKSFQVPDLVWLAEMSEQAQIDLQAVIVSRNYVDVVISTFVHRSFGARLEAGQIGHLLPSTFALFQQLALLDEAFLPACFDFDDKNLSFVDRLEDSLEVEGLASAIRSSFHAHRRRALMSAAPHSITPEQKADLMTRNRSGLRVTQAIASVFCRASTVTGT